MNLRDDEATTDYRLGWRWLAPLRSGDRVLLEGFSRDEEGFLKRMLACHDATVGFPQAEVLLAMDPEPPEEGGEYPGLQGCCILGEGPRVRKWMRWAGGRFPRCSLYALLPPGRPRVVVPLGTPRHVRLALSLHRPGRRLARWLTVMLGGLAAVGVTRPLQRRLLLVAGDRGREPMGSDLFRGAGTAEGNEYVLYLGTPDDNRKTVVLVLSDGESAIEKHGATPKAVAALENEAAVLGLLKQTPVAARVPVLLGHRVEDGRAALRQTYRRRRWILPSSMRREVVRFLVDLARVEPANRLLSRVLEEGEVREGIRWCREHGLGEPVILRLEGMGRQGRQLAGHRCHGDFAPWNSIWTRQGLLVFDWEASRPWEPALADAFYYSVAPALHVPGRRRAPGRVRRAAWAFARQVAAGSGMEPDVVPFYWALWLLARLGERPDDLYQMLMRELERSWNESVA